eukprot:SAG11_NODE_172_length_13574_cov_14.732690_1_plen_106_part_00
MPDGARISPVRWDHCAIRILARSYQWTLCQSEIGERRVAQFAVAIGNTPRNTVLTVFGVRPYTVRRTPQPRCSGRGFRQIGSLLLRWVCGPCVVVPGISLPHHAK